MIMIHRNTIGSRWTDETKKYGDIHTIGSIVKKILSDKEQAVELLKILQEQAEEYEAEGMDIYFDESASTIFMTVKLFDGRDRQLQVFNIEHSIQKHEFVFLLEFLEFGFEHEVNVYTFRGRVAEGLNEYVDECYEIGTFKDAHSLKRR